MPPSHSTENILSRLTLEYSPEAILKYFTPLAHQPWGMLLYSASAEHPHNRFDILVAQPRVMLTTYGANTWVAQEQQQYCSQQDPLSLIEQILSHQFPSIEAQQDLPFCGGALGLWGYDLGRRFELLPQIAQNDIHVPDMAVGIYDWALIADHQQQKLTLISWQDAQSRLNWLNQQLAYPPVAPLPFTLTSAWSANMNQEQYAQRFHQIQHHIHAGDCYQINLTQRFSAAYQGDEWQAFLRLSVHNRAPFSAYIRLTECSILSLSPERFLQLEKQQITTRPIKGTLPRAQNSQHDHAQAARLASSVKDRAENLMIVDLMRNDIGRVAQPGSVQVPQLFAVETFPAIYHLVSTITATLPDPLNATHLLRACFPGGSITGAPKIRAMELIEQLEPQRRSVYCGSIGYISCCGNMDTNISIRTLLAERGQIHCWAGGGIVADSQFDKEYQETFDKVSKILPILADTLEISS